jgi:dTDP-4-dehydrorhamnose 3,5-epimerase-like enzyme
MDTIDLNTVGNDSVGYLSFFEGNKHIPFEIKRIYYIYGVPRDTIRGHHAHFNLTQFLWCPYGSILISLDDGLKKESILLDNPSTGILIQKGIWHEMRWEIDYSVLCVVASDVYKEEDYIRNYDEFMKYVREGYWNE